MKVSLELNRICPLFNLRAEGYKRGRLKLKIEMPDDQLGLIRDKYRKGKSRGWGGWVDG